jgi:arylsulfatase A-like enzyme
MNIRKFYQKNKQFFEFISLSITVGFILGIFYFLSELITKNYLDHKMYRNVALLLQDNINRISFKFIILFLFLYLVLFFIKKQFKAIDLQKSGILLISIISGLFIVDLFLKIYTGYSIEFIVNRVYVKYNNFFSGQMSFDVLVSQTLGGLKKIIIILLISIIFVVLLFLFHKKKSFRKLDINLKKYNKASLVVIFFIIIFNIFFTLYKRLPDNDQPNVIFIVVDTLRADHLSCYGYNRETTPNIDELAQDSILFKNAISHAPWTTPSIASLFTSKYPAQHGFNGEPVILNSSCVTLAEVFRENGYKTKGIISVSFISSKLGFGRGFDDYDEGEAKGHNYISSSAIAEKSVKFLEKNRKEKFFLFLHFFDPHWDYIMHQKYNYFENYDGLIQSGQKIGELLELAKDMTDHDIKFVKSMYDSEIKFTDEYIGKIIKKLKDLNLYSSTAIFFTADHGEEFLERGNYYIGHGKTLYQEQIHIPLIIKLQNNSIKKIRDELIGINDIFPTVIDIAQLKKPKNYRFEGKAINFEKKLNKNSKFIVSETHRGDDLVSVTWNSWKLIYHIKNDVYELYNLKNDNKELHNLFYDNKDKDFIANMKKIIFKHLQKYKRKNYKAKKPKFSEKQIEELKSLGYIK